MFWLYVKTGRRWQQVAYNHNVRPLIDLADKDYPDMSYRITSQGGTAVLYHLISPLGDAIFANAEAR